MAEMPVLVAVQQIAGSVGNNVLFFLSPYLLANRPGVDGRIQDERTASAWGSEQERVHLWRRQRRAKVCG